MTQGVFATDLDGTFIDHDTYQPGSSIFAARRLNEQGVQLVFCSSKTVAEQSVIRDLTELPVIMITENGSAIYRPGSSAPEILGCSAGSIRRAAKDVREETGIDLRLMGEVDVSEAMRCTGLTEASAALAQQREFSESVVSPVGDRQALGELAAAFARRGFAATMGGRFLTIHGPDASKGEAVARVLADYPVVSGAVGDGPNDVSMLAEVDFPYLIRGKGAKPSILDLPKLTYIDESGPAGFVLAAEDFLLRGLNRAGGS